MKIDSTTPSAVTLAKTRQQRPSGPGPATGAAGESAVATLSHSQATDPAGAPVDGERIAEIRQAIADGKLQINAERIADRLIQGAREQFAKGQRS
ncbi:MAG: flagellar biosynthesis anti-sigma factor FlgM [Rhodocyclales bacterium]|nr:flagellar biosynthesis anti-sigma factor FlgM [Rhodocyclales bacterium]